MHATAARLQARCGSRASEGVASAEGCQAGIGMADGQSPVANPGLLSEHERSVLLALMLLRHTVRRSNTGFAMLPKLKDLAHLRLVRFACISIGRL